MALTFNTNLKNVAAHYIQLLNVKITDSSIRKSIEENPHFPTLLCLSDVFDQFKIENEAIEIGAENIGLMEPPFVAYVNLPKVGSDFILVTKMEKNEVDFIYQSNKKETITKDEFITRYRKIVWVAEPDKQVIEEHYYDRR